MPSVCSQAIRVTDGALYASTGPWASPIRLDRGPADRFRYHLRAGHFGPRAGHFRLRAAHSLGSGGVASAVPSRPDPLREPGCRWPSYMSLLLSVHAYSMISQPAGARGMT